MALTDHDEVAGIPELVEAGAELGIEVLSGVEISTSWEDLDLHLLAYGFDPQDPGITEMLDRARTGRRDRARRMVEKLGQLDVPVALGEVERIAGEGAVGRPHVARALLEAGHVKTLREAFDRYLGDGKPACVEKAKTPPEDAIARVHAAGGVTSVAHPVVIGGRETLERLLPVGADGVEVRHSLHGKASEAAFDDFARANGLLRTGGSDFHGPRSSGLAVGSISIPREWWEELKDRIRERREAAARNGKGA